MATVEERDRRIKAAQARNADRGVKAAKLAKELEEIGEAIRLEEATIKWWQDMPVDVPLTTDGQQVRYVREQQGGQQDPGSDNEGQDRQ